MADARAQGDGGLARAQARPLHRRVRDPRHRPDPEGRRLRLRAVRHRALGLRLRDHQERARATCRRPTCRRSCGCRRKEYHHIARAADMGAEGVMLPMVGSPEEARAILDCLKYVPDGRRGVALGDRPRPLPARADPRQARRGQPADHAVRPDRDPAGRRERRCAGRARPASTACGSATSTSAARSASRASSTTRTSPTRSRPSTKACRKHGKALGRLVPTVDEAVALHARGLRLPLLLRRRLGAPGRGPGRPRRDPGADRGGKAKGKDQSKRSKSKKK